MTQFDTWGSYFIPGTKVLRNRLGIRDEADLQRAEDEIVRIRLAECFAAARINGDFDRSHMQSIHEHLFGDVYEWAGQPRTAPTGGPMSKNGPTPGQIQDGEYSAVPSHAYAYFQAGEEMLRHFDQEIESLAQVPADLDSKEFAGQLAETWGELNCAHIFREGNTRTQVVFFTYFAQHHGHELDYERFLNDLEFRFKFNAGRFIVLHDPTQGTLLRETLEVALDSSPALVAPVDAEPVDPAAYYQPHYADE